MIFPYLLCVPYLVCPTLPGSHVPSQRGASGGGSGGPCTLCHTRLHPPCAEASSTSRRSRASRTKSRARSMPTRQLHASARTAASHPLSPPSIAAHAVVWTRGATFQRRASHRRRPPSPHTQRPRLVRRLRQHPLRLRAGVRARMPFVPRQTRARLRCTTREPRWSRVKAPMHSPTLATSTCTRTFRIALHPCRCGT